MNTPAQLSPSIVDQATRAKRAAARLASASPALRSAALEAMADALIAGLDTLLEANALDLTAARSDVERGTLNAHFVDRLALSPARIEAMANALREVAALPDPVGSEDSSWLRPNGLRVARRRIPLGTIGIIYEARPNVTSDAAGLCIKSGNAVILKGGSRAIHSNRACVALLQRGLRRVGLNPDVLQFIDSTDRTSIVELLSLDELIDLIIPRGGEGLIRFVCANSRIPVIKHYKGVCHIFLDASARLDLTTPILLNSKVQRPSVCNSLETLLVHKDAAERLLPSIAASLIEAGVTLHLDPRALAICSAPSLNLPSDHLLPATNDDFHAEYLSLDLAVAVCDSMDDAIAHIQRYGSEHTEAILTESIHSAQDFTRRVNSSVVLVNASTRFSDGGQLGLGAEIGISTTKLHAFGPMGLRELTTTKFVVHGSGQVRP